MRCCTVMCVAASLLMDKHDEIIWVLAIARYDLTEISL